MFLSPVTGSMVITVWNDTDEDLNVPVTLIKSMITHRNVSPEGVNIITHPCSLTVSDSLYECGVVLFLESFPVY